MIEIRPTGTESWLNARFARRLSAKLGRRLWERCQGRRGLFVTLTYRRDEYASPLDLYRKQSEHRHVREFLRRVARHLGRDLSGKWFCKLEFQRGGWVHWHLIILDVEKIPHAAAMELWGHGHVWLRRLNKKNVKYCTKYTCKADQLPAWLMAERPRSIKIVRVSPRFWGEVEHSEQGGEDDEAVDESLGVSTVIDAYVPLGHRLDNDGGKFVARDIDSGQYRRGSSDLGMLLLSLFELGCAVVENRSGWLVVDATMEQLDRAEKRAAAAGEARSAALLHLRRTGNPHTWWLPPWLHEWHRERILAEGGVV